MIYDTYYRQYFTFYYFQSIVCNFIYKLYYDVIFLTYINCDWLNFFSLSRQRDSFQEKERDAVV